MHKEREPKFESSFSEKDLDLALDRSLNSDQTKAATVFDPQKKKTDKKK